MPENLLSISNISIFGQLVADIEIVDPEGKKNVRAATTEEIKAPGKLEGLLLDKVPLRPGDRLLVKDQTTPAENGIYQVGSDAPYKWEKILQDFPNNSIITVKEGTKENRKSRWRLRRSTAVVSAKTEIKITATDLKKPSTIDQVTVQKYIMIEPLGAPTKLIVEHIDLLVTPEFIDTSKHPNITTAKVANAINRDSNNTRYRSTSSGYVLTLFPPKAEELPLKGGVNREVVATGDNLTITSAGGAASPIAFSEGTQTSTLTFEKVPRNSFAGKRQGVNQQLEQQLGGDARFARIYGFSFEGTYYDLPRPALFLVHGDGELVTVDEPQDNPEPNLARAPGATSLTGLAAADFDFADGLRAWSYDKADYTIRMDVDTGMFEQVLLEATLGGGPGSVDARGMQARGMQARGMQARGMQARGMQARGGGNNSD